MVMANYLAPENDLVNYLPARINPNLAAQGRRMNLAERQQTSPLMQAGNAQLAKELASMGNRGAVPDLINRGLIANTAGLPVDMLNTVLQTLGLGSEQPLGGSDSIRRALEFYGLSSETQRPMLETLASLTPPRAVMGAARVAGQGAEAVGRAAAPVAGQALENYMVRSGGILPMDTWHGSPHRFPPTKNNPLGEFDPMKIGTGEGAQAYGHGLYLAENPGVAKGYQKDVTRKLFDTNSILGWGEGRVKLTPGDSGMLFQYARGTLSPIEAAKKLKINAGSAGAYSDETIADAITKIREQTKGNLYKVDLPDEQIAKMLDWDKPLSQQHPDVRAAFKDFPKTMSGGDAYRAKSYGVPPSGFDEQGNALFDGMAALSGRNPQQASKALRELGIPGIRYLDQGSRAAPSSAQFVKADVVGAADDLTALAKSMGLDAEVRHSGSNAGKSSYVSVFDPMTNRYIKSAFRISDHGTGALRHQEHIHINSPADLVTQKNDLFEWVKRNRTEKGVDTTDLRAPSQGTSNFVVFDPAHMNIIGRE